MNIARILSLAAIAVIAGVAPAHAQDQTPLASNFLYNYYTQPGASAVQAGMYPAPHYVPSNVGHTYYTYQPLMPHEHMYDHARNYYNYYAPSGTFYSNPCGNNSGSWGLNKTTVIWQTGCTHLGPAPWNWACAERLQNRLANHQYCLGGGLGCGIGGCGHHGCGPHGCGLRHHHHATAGCATGDCSGGGDCK